MGITLYEAMSIAPFSSAHIIGGAAGLNRTVESANIQEVPEVGRWLHGGEILFSSGYAFKSTEDAVELIKQLHKMKVAALAIKPAQYLSSIPQELIDCANQLRFPLFELPEDLPYMDCIIPIFERITQKQLAIMRQVERIHNCLMDSILHNGGLPGICQVLHSVTGSSVFIVSSIGSVLAQILADSPDDSPKCDYWEKVIPHLSRNLFRTMQRNKCNAINIGTDIRLTCIPVFVQDRLLAFLLLDKPYDKMPEMDLIAYENASSLIAIELLNEEALIQKEQRIREQLLDDILTHRYNDNDVIYQRGQYAGFDLHSPHRIMVISPGSFEHYVYDVLHCANEESVQNVKFRLRTMIEQCLSNYPAPVLISSNGIRVIAMIQVKGSNSDKWIYEIQGNMKKRLSQEFPHLQLTIGIGQIKVGLSNTDTSYQEAIVALQANRSLHRNQEKCSVTFFDQLGCLSFLCDLQHSKAMLSFYETHLCPILEYDKENQTSLVATLDAFFANGQNLRRTAESLYVHKNSVIYRLHKIEDIIGSELSDPTTSFNLQLCLQLRNII